MAHKISELSRRLKISQTLKGRKKPLRSKEHSQKIAEAHRGKKASLETKQKMSVAHKDEKHWAWKGDNASYVSLHHWVRRNLGKAIWCSHCMSTVNVQWANISHQYKRDLNDWMQLCFKCHAKYDKGTLGASKNFVWRNKHYRERKII